MRRHGLVVGLVALAACSSSGGGSPPPDADLSDFAIGTEVSAYVLENVTACEVDAVCFLRLEFADTTVVALYGTGERPAPCRISGEASDAGFAAEPEEVITLVLFECGTEGAAIERVTSS